MTEEFSRAFLINKDTGETPLEAIERFRLVQSEGILDSQTKMRWLKTPITYAGRLDPLAKGKMFVLIGDECKNKNQYLNLDKEYEVEILFGISTDTYDALGLIDKVVVSDLEIKLHEINLSKYIGKFTQPYPPYSSKTVGGKYLHALARSGELPDVMPAKKVEIYSIDILDSRNIHGNTIMQESIENIRKVKGNFRQDEIINNWMNFGDKYKDLVFSTLFVRVNCSSGTYMRSLAHKMGNDIKIGAIAWSINRTKILPYNL